MRAPPSVSLPRDACCAAAIFLFALGVFWCSPRIQMGDSKYTLLLSHSLLTRGSFRLDGYGLPPQPPDQRGGDGRAGRIYQLEMAGGHLYYFFPPGSSVLSAPFVWVSNLCGHPVVRPDGAYDPEREGGAQHALAALLMAGLAAIFYFTARLRLPPGWSALVALGGALGTQIWSTASRGLWTHTWGVLLLGAAVYLLAREAGRSLRPVLLASVLSWAYFVRPTNSVFILGATGYVLLYQREAFLPYAATGAAWFLAFVAYSWTLFGQILPSYYLPNRLQSTHLQEALAGNLISPSRGLLVYVPVTLFVFYLLARHWRRVGERQLVWLALAVGAGHLAAVSGFSPWFGGSCYGPRYTTELVPSLVLAAVLGLRAALDWRGDSALRPSAWEWTATRAAGGALLLLSAAIQERGAVAGATVRWNERPVAIDREPTRVWDWRRPQMLAGLVPDDPAAPVNPRLAFGGEAGRTYLKAGWAAGEGNFCWTERREATLAFAASDPTADRLRLCFEPNLYRDHPRRQRLTLLLNGRQIARLSADYPEPTVYEAALPPGILRRENTLAFQLPDAASPRSEDGSNDDRLLGIALHWMELRGARPPGQSQPPL